MNPSDLTPPAVAAGGALAAIIAGVPVIVWAIRYTVSTLGPMMSQMHFQWAQQAEATKEDLAKIDDNQQRELNVLTATVTDLTRRVAILEAKTASQSG